MSSAEQVTMLISLFALISAPLFYFLGNNKSELLNAKEELELIKTKFTEYCAHKDKEIDSLVSQLSYYKTRYSVDSIDSLLSNVMKAAGVKMIAINKKKAMECLTSNIASFSERK